MSRTSSAVFLTEASIRSIMTTQVKTIATTKPVVECIKIMKEADIGSVVVVDDAKPIGIFTERDLVKRIGEKLENLGSPMSRVMTRPLITTVPTATVWDALVTMGKYDIRRLPVIQDRKLVGIVTERDIFRLILREQTMLLEAFSEYLPASAKENIAGAVGALGIGKPPSRI
jgi:CBS domain-containing protein